MEVRQIGAPRVVEAYDCDASVGQRKAGGSLGDAVQRAVLGTLILEPLAQLVAVHDGDLELKAVEMRSDDVLRLGVGNEHLAPP